MDFWTEVEAAVDEHKVEEGKVSLWFLENKKELPETRVSNNTLRSLIKIWASVV